MSENTARMRVERALDKLHALLARRGVTSTTGALANQAVVAAPAGLAVTVTGAVLAGAGTGVAATGAAAVTFMGLTKLQLGLTGVIAAAGASGFLIEEAANQALKARQPTSEQIAALGQSRAEAERLRREVPALRERLDALLHPPPASEGPQPPLAAGAVRNVGRATPGATIETALWR